MLITGGSYIELLNAYNIKDNEIENNSKLENREKLNIQSFKTIIKILKDSSIHYMIFFIPNYIHDNLDEFLVRDNKLKETQKGNKIEENKIENYKEVETEVEKRYEKDVWNDGIKETKIDNKKIDKKEESKKEDKTKEIQKKDNIKIENSINNNDINLEQNIYSTYYAKEIYKKIIIFKINF